MEIRGWIKTMQTTALLRSDGILRRVMETWWDLLSLTLLWKTVSECWCEFFYRSKMITIYNNLPNQTGLLENWFFCRNSKFKRWCFKHFRRFLTSGGTSWFKRPKLATSLFCNTRASQKLCNILVLALFKQWKVTAVVHGIVVDGVLLRYALLYSVYDLKSSQMNVQGNLIQEFTPYEFELGHNATEATKMICYGKGEVAVDQSIVTRWFKKFRWGCKYLSDQARSGRSKTENFEVLIKVTETKRASCPQRVSGELDTSRFSVVHHPYHSGKSLPSRIVL